MAKTNRRPSDKLERKQRLDQRTHHEDAFNERDWLRGLDDQDQDDQSEIHGAAVDLIAA